MRGLLRKEWYLIRRHCRTYLAVAALFLVTSAAVKSGGGNLFMTFYPCILAGIVPTTLLAYDEQSRWNVYSDTLACTRAQVVSAKYLTGLLLELGMILLCVAASLFRMSRGTAVSGRELLLQTGLMVLVSLLIPVISLPLMLRFGVEKGRIFFFAAVTVTCVGSLALSRTMLGDSTDQIPPHASAIAVGAVLAGLALYGLSWLLSIRLYQNREL